MDTKKLTVGRDVYMYCGPCAIAKGKVVEIASSGATVQMYSAFSNFLKEPAELLRFDRQGESWDRTYECGPWKLTDSEQLITAYESGLKQS